METAFAILPFLSLASAVACLFVGGRIYSLNPANRTNRLFTLLCIIATYWVFTEYQIRRAGTPLEAKLWMEMGFLWPFSVPAIVHFVLVYTKHAEWLKNRWIILSMYPAALLFSGLEMGTDLITQGVRKTYWGYGLIQSGSWVSWTCNLWDVGWMIFCFALLIRYCARTVEERERIQTRFIILGFLIPVVGAILTESVFFHLNIPELNSVTLGVSCLLVGYGIRKHGLFSLDPAMAVESIAASMSARVKAEEALRKSEERYRNLVDNSPDLIYRLDLEGNIKAVNESAIRFMGYVVEADLIGKNYMQFVHPDDREKVMGSYLEMIRTKRKRTTGLVFRMLDGSGNVAWSELYSHNVFDENGNYLEEIGIIRDITERMKAQEAKEKVEQEMYQAQKMQAVGTLAGGIAHDFNNILAIINGHSELLLMDEETGEAVRSGIESILHAVHRGRDLAQQILTFSCTDTREMSPVNVSETVREAIRFIRATLPTTVLIRQKIDCDGAWILGNSTQINQVLINLCTNAADAMRKTGGTLDIGLSEVSLSSSEAEARGLSHPGPFLSLSVRDTGHGMDDELVKRIFDPFFTTKRKGKGTGLGLAVVHGIVKRHEGHIACTSEPGKGTLFDVLLPKHEPAMLLEISTKEQLARQTESVPEASAPRCLGHILFVDDERQIVNVYEQLLGRLGYRTTMLTSSVQALDAFRSDPHCFDLVVTDMTMPNVNGLDLAREILRIRPDIPIILCTGFSELSSPETAREAGVRELFMKPIPVREFVATIGDLIRSAA